MSQQDFSAAFRRSPMKRAKLRGLQRNAAVVLGNAGTVDDVPTLVSALASTEPLVRQHAAWALGRIASAAALDALRARFLVEPDPLVQNELSAAISMQSG
jgi:epoxyqueuosine reductase